LTIQSGDNTILVEAYPLYALYLYADAYDFEDLKAIAESVTFSEDAFVRE
jgi:hypothetical protein